MTCTNCGKPGPANIERKWIEAQTGNVVSRFCCIGCRDLYLKRMRLPGYIQPAANLSALDLPEPPKHPKLGPGCPQRQWWEDDPETRRLAWGDDACRLDWLDYLADHRLIPELTETLVGGNYQPVPEPPKEAPVFSALPERGPQQSPNRNPVWGFMFGPPLI